MPTKPWQKPKAGAFAVGRYRGTETDIVFPTEIEGIKITGVANTSGRAPENYKKIRSVILPEGYTRIRNMAFAGCESLERIALPSTLREIGTGAFSDCKSLKEIILHPGICYTGNSPFLGAQIGTVILYPGEEKLPANLFLDCKIAVLIVPDGDLYSSGNIFGYSMSIEDADTKFPENVYMNGRFNTYDLKECGGTNVKKIHPLSDLDFTIISDEAVRTDVKKNKQKTAFDHQSLIVKPETVDSIIFNDSVFVFDFDYYQDVKFAVRERGGIIQDKVTNSTDYCIVPDYTIITDSKTKKIIELQKKGNPVHIISVSECRRHL